MHGEFKVPGGKLVVVDFDIEDDRIARFRLSGDFFLDPDEGLAAINAGLTGMPSDSDARALGAAVRSALPDDAVMLGFSPEAVATAVRRAIGGATSWRDYDWQYLRTGPLDPVMHVALDQVLTEEVAAGRRKPTLRIWEWNTSAVVIGSFQSVRNEVDPQGAARHGFSVVRRMSGGGAMLMGAGEIITYSIYAPSALVAGMSFADSYAFLDDWTVAGLQSLGVEASYVPLNDITSPGGKIGGAAQKRLAEGGVLHHVTMSYDMDGQIMTEVLRIGREKLSDKGVTSAAKRVDPLKSQTGLPREEIIERLVGIFRDRHGLTDDELTPEEFDRAEELVKEKFGTDEWLYRVP